MSSNLNREGPCTHARERSITVRAGYAVRAHVPHPKLVLAGVRAHLRGFARGLKHGHEHALGQGCELEFEPRESVHARARAKQNSARRLCCGGGKRLIVE